MVIFAGDWAFGNVGEAESVLQQTGVSTGRLFPAQAAEFEGTGLTTESCGQETPALPFVPGPCNDQTPQTRYIISVLCRADWDQANQCFESVNVVFLSVIDDCPVRDRERRAALMHFSSEANLDTNHKKHVLIQDTTSRYCNVVIVKGIVHFEIHFWYVLAYLKDIQDVGVFVSTVFSILIFLGQSVLVYQSYNGGLWSPPQRACTEKCKLNMI